MERHNMQRFFSFTQFVFASTLLSSLFSYQADAADILTDLPAVSTALEQGRSVSVAIDLGKCQPNTHKGRGGFKIKAYRISADNTLVFSDHHFTVLPSGQAIIEFMRYRIQLDQTVHFTVDKLALPHYTAIGEQKTYTCRVNEGFNLYAAHE